MLKYGRHVDSGPTPTRNLIAACGWCSGAIGLLKPGISLEQAPIHVGRVSSQLRAEYATNYPAGSGWSIEVVPLQESLVGNAGPCWFVLMGAWS